MKNRREKFMRLACIAGLLLAAVQGWGQVAPVLWWRFEGAGSYTDDSRPAPQNQNLLTANISTGGPTNPIATGGVNNTGYVRLRTNNGSVNGLLYNACWTSPSCSPSASELLGTAGQLEQFTVMGWFRPGDLNGYYLFTMEGYFALYLEEDRFLIRTTHLGGVTEDIEIPLPGPKGTLYDPCHYVNYPQWVNIALRYDHASTNQWALFVDGKIIYKGSGINLSPLGPLAPTIGLAFRAGHFGTSPITRAANDVDEILLYSVPVCDIEINRLHNDLTAVGPSTNVDVATPTSCASTPCPACIPGPPPMVLDPRDFPKNYDFIIPTPPTPIDYTLIDPLKKQLLNWPAPRFKPGSSIHRNIPYFVFSSLQENSATPAKWDDAADIMAELSSKFNYTFQIASRDANEYDAAFSGGSSASISMTDALYKKWSSMSPRPPISIYTNWESVPSPSHGYEGNLYSQSLPDDYYMHTATGAAGACDFLGYLNANCFEALPTPPPPSTGEYIDLICTPAVNKTRSWTPPSPIYDQEDGEKMRLYHLLPYRTQYGVNIDYVTENGEVQGLNKPFPLLGGHTYCCLTNVAPGTCPPCSICTLKDPRLDAAFSTFGIGGCTSSACVKERYELFIGTQMAEIRTSYKTGLMSGSIANHFSWYNIGGDIHSFYPYPALMSINSPEGTRRYATPYFYPYNCTQWKKKAGPHSGLTTIETAVKIQLATPATAGTSNEYCSPFITPGYADNSTVKPRDRDMLRPAAYLGVLKAMSIMGAEYFHPFVYQEGYVGENTHSPRMSGWQIIAPSLVQASVSRCEDLYRNSNLMSGGYISSAWSDNGYRFHASKPNHMVYARRGDLPSNSNQYLIVGFIGGYEDASASEPNAEVYHPETGNTTIDIGTTSVCPSPCVSCSSNHISFGVRRQGSMYFFDNSNPSEPIFYQLDAWHDKDHFSWWTKDVEIEAELWDNNVQNTACSPFIIKTEDEYSHKPICDGNFTQFTSFVSIPCTTACYDDVSLPPYLEYTFQLRSDNAADHAVSIWVKARTKKNITGFWTALNPGTPTEKLLNGVIIANKGDFHWYKVSLPSTISSPLLMQVMRDHVLRITPFNSDLEIDAVRIDDLNDGATWSPTYPEVAGIPCNLGFTNTSSYCAGDPAIFTMSSCSGENWPGCTQVTWDYGDGTSPFVSDLSSYIFTHLYPSTPATYAPSICYKFASYPAICFSSSVTIGSLSLSITGPTDLCPGETDHIIVTPISSSPPSAFTYTWTSTATFSGSGNDITTTGAGSGTQTYSVTVIDGAGCSGTASWTVEHLTAPTPVISSPSTYCYPENVVFTLLPPAYASQWWSPSGTGTSITVPCTGPTCSVTVWAMDTKGCVGSTSKTITGNPTPIVTLLPEYKVCYDDYVDIVPIITGGSGSYDFAWSDGSSLSSVSVLGDGTGSSVTYSVTVTDLSTGCTATASTNLIHLAKVTTSITATPNPYCVGSPLTLTVPSGYSAYSWGSGSTTTNSYTITGPPGSYSDDVVVTDADGCTGTASITVPGITGAPVSVTGPAGTCAGEYVTLTATAGFTSYTWSTGATTPTISVNTPGTYTVTVSGSSGCPSTATFVLNAYLGCCTGCPALTGETNLETGFPNFEMSCATMTTLPYGSSLAPDCGSTTTWGGSNQFKIQDAFPNPWAMALLDHTTGTATGNVFMGKHNSSLGGTFGDIAWSKEISVTGGFNYNFKVWFRGISTSGAAPEVVLTVTQAGTTELFRINPSFNDWVQYCGHYTAIATGTARFEVRVRRKLDFALDDIYIAHAGPSIDLGTTGPVCVGTTLSPTITPAGPCTYAYAWCTPPGCTTPVTTSTFAPAAPNLTYRLTVNCTSSGCSSWVNFNSIQCAAKTAEPDPTALFSVHPNPSFGLFEVAADLPDTGPVTLTVTAANGVRIVERTVETSDPAFRETLDLQQYAAGVYTLNVTWQGQQWLYRLVKQ